jgi:hypothetical protein
MGTVNELGTLNTFNRCALVPTRNKVCTVRGWQHTLPMEPDDFESYWTKKLAQGFEPAVTLRTSGLIGFEADGEDDYARLRDTLTRHEAKPWVVEARDDDPYRVHVYALQPKGIDLPKVSFRFEGGGLIAASNNYFRCSYFGGPYYIIAVNSRTKPMDVRSYAGLLAEAKVAAHETRRARREGAPLAEGSRRNEIFRFGCFLSRWMDDLGLAIALADRWQEAYCDPPVPHPWVEKQVTGAWKVAESEGRLGCEVFAHATKRVQAYNFSTALSPWCGEDPALVAELVEAWVA